MDISPPHSQTTPAASQQPPAQMADRVLSSDFETFLRMLTVQLQNQDPLNPVDSADYALQLATFSGVEQQVMTNNLLRALSSQFATSSLANIAGWVGREARVQAPVAFEGKPITIVPQVAAQAESAELVVRDTEGIEIERRTIPVPAEPLDWVGIGAEGAPLPPGPYTFHVISHAGGEQLQEVQAAVYAPVREVRLEGGMPAIVLAGGATVAASGVTALRG